MLTKDLDGPLDTLEGLGDEEMESLQGWEERFLSKYLVVGKLVAQGENITQRERRDPTSSIKMLALPVLFLSMLGQVVSLPARDADLVPKDTSLIQGSRNTIIKPRTLPIYGNSWQYDMEECQSGDRARLRYHIMMTGNGQDIDAWCENFERRLMYKCDVDEPDFYNCNIGRAPMLPELETYAYDAWEGRVVTMQGINLRFDFTKSWYTDAYHKCVAETISEVTCRGANQRLGLRCLPVLWRAPRDQTTSNRDAGTILALSAVLAMPGMISNKGGLDTKLAHVTSAAFCGRAPNKADSRRVRIHDFGNEVEIRRLQIPRMTNSM
ncbi:hypothetical protein NUW58_g3629 [Xylaria curta]|uniref:Uncharacterized protein n=1 Tax=Xylaria curta TaxID=42375 RepID=A0ACC1PA34_9PEZI|nr:hypothetical protein NUW58_g3629 [Xylaria curta]